MHIGVVVNCHVLPITKSLSNLAGVDSVFSVPIHLYGRPPFIDAAENFERLAQKPETVILSFQNGKAFGAYEIKTLRERVQPLYTLTNVNFSGLQPDIIYLGDQAGRIQSPIGDYHSKLIIHSFIQGLSPDQCQKRFNAKEFERLGLFRAYDVSKAELLRRDAELDIRFAKMFFELVNEVPCLYTINHPTPAVFQEFSSFIADFLGLTKILIPYEMLPNYLASSSWWPIYEPIREFHQLKYETPMLFKQPESLGGRFMGMEEFIARSYAIYNQIPVRIANARQVVSLLSDWPI